MDKLERIKARIREIIQRRTNVTPDEIEWVISQIDRLEGFVTRSRATKGGHSTLHRVTTENVTVIFNVATHNPGSREVKPCYVDEFESAMTELELYED